MSTWQRCPICNGSGTVFDNSVVNAVCPTCRGERIISTITGNPPSGDAPIRVPKKEID